MNVVLMLKIHTMQKWLNYLKYSGIWIGFVLNPYHWEFKLQTEGPTDLDPNMHFAFLTLGPFWIRIVVDDGGW